MAFRSPSLLALMACAAAVEVEPAKLATADAAPVAPGTCEVAFGAAHTTAQRVIGADGVANDRGGRLSETGFSVGLTCGVVEGFDAGIGFGYVALSDAAADPDHGAGASDIELGAKWRFWAGSTGDSAVAVALLPSLTVPMGRDEDAANSLPVASRCWTAGLTMAASGNLDIVSLNADAGYTQAFGSADERAGLVSAIAANTAVGVQVLPWLQPGVELSWARDRVEDGEAPWSLTLTGGAQLGLPWGRLGLGFQQVIAGAGVDLATGLIADLAIAF